MKKISILLISILLGCLFSLASIKIIMPYHAVNVIVMGCVIQLLLLLIGKRLNIFCFIGVKKIICNIIFIIISFILFVVSNICTSTIMYSMLMSEFH